MPVERLPSGLWIAAVRRSAAASGIPLMVLQRGDETSGGILLKINLTDGQTRLFSQVLLDDELAWMVAGERDPLPEKEADMEAQERGENDPDLWIVEIEDREGRLWFEGRVLEI